MDPVIITCAVTGSIHTPSMSPYLPYAPGDIARQSIDAANAGAAILHLHARDPDNGRPSADPAHWRGFLPAIKAGTDAIINMTTGGSAVMSLDARLAAPLAAAPEMCSLNMGSMNFALYPLADRITDWRFDWERPFLQGTDDLVFKNTPRDIAHILHEMGRTRGARFEFECYDVSHIHMLRHFMDRGLIDGPVFVQFVMGVLGGIGADMDNLKHLKHMADKLLGSDYMFSVLAAGRHQLPMAAAAAEMGGHVRVGLEDNLMIARGELAPSNAALVTAIRERVEAQGRRIATPAEARAMLRLKGAEATAI